MHKIKKVNGNFVDNNNKLVFLHFPMAFGSSLIKLWLRLAGETNFRMANKLQQNRQSQNKTKRKKNVETKQTNRKPHKLSDDDPAMNSPLCP